jgi:hypothetical protein
MDALPKPFLLPVIFSENRRVVERRGPIRMALRMLRGRVVYWEGIAATVRVATFGLLIGPDGYYIRSHMSETPGFLDAGAARARCAISSPRNGTGSARVSGMSLSYNLGVAVFGGFAPSIAQTLIDVTGGSKLAPSYYMIARF